VSKKKKKYKRVPRHQRDAATLLRLRAEHGNLTYTEGLDRLRNRRPGPKQKWVLDKRVDIYLTVEAFKAKGVRPTEAKRLTAKYYKLRPNVVEKVWAGARDDFAAFEPTKAESVSLHLAGEPRLRKLLQEIKPAAETPAI
jgi:hypothetical protein